jgi:hypothetical protein
MIETFALLIGGLIALLIGGELLVRGAVRLAEKAGVTPLVVGLVIVGLPLLVSEDRGGWRSSQAWRNVDVRPFQPKEMAACVPSIAHSGKSGNGPDAVGQQRAPSRSSKLRRRSPESGHQIIGFGVPALSDTPVSPLQVRDPAEADIRS